MRKTNLFIDGSSGTAGLQFYDRVSGRDDINIITLSSEDRHNPVKRAEMLNECDIAVLCLPDEAAVESVSLITNDKVRVIDCSTAHRTAPGWIYGFPEPFPGRKEEIASARFVANPGCHASGFISLVAPLVREGIIPASAHISCHSITGYSGGGKKMIAAYEDANRPELYNAPRQYGLTQKHKHLPEMQYVCGLDTAPIFCPIVADYYSGMCVTVPLFSSDIKGSIDDIKAVFKNLYTTGNVSYTENPDEDGLLSALHLSCTDRMEISVFGNDERIILVSRFDNLGKGAAGSAVQNLNIMLKD